MAQLISSGEQRSSKTATGSRPTREGRGGLTRIIHEHFCCNRGFAAATSLRRAGSPLVTSPYRFKYASVSQGFACPSRNATARFRDELS